MTEDLLQAENVAPCPKVAHRECVPQGVRAASDTRDSRARAPCPDDLPQSVPVYGLPLARDEKGICLQVAPARKILRQRGLRSLTERDQPLLLALSPHQHCLL